MVAVLALAPAAHAEPALIAAAGNFPDDTVLVGAAGEIYHRQGGAWHRSDGGVAVTLTSAWASHAGNVWAVGQAAPIFHHNGVAWLTVSGARGGPALVAVPGSPLPGLAVGKRLFAGVDGELAKMAAAPGRPSALWLRTPGDALVVVDGKLLRLAGGWKPIKTPGDEGIVALCGAREGAIAVVASGAVFAVEARRLRRLAPSGYRGCSASRSRVVVTGDGGAMAEVTAAGLTALPPLPDGQAVAFVYPFPVRGGELAVSLPGRIYLRDGGAWSEEKVDGSSPAAHDSRGAAPAVIPAPPASR